MKFRLQQLTCRGFGTSSGIFEGDYAAIVRSVHAHHVVGEPRAAVEEGTGVVVYALDAEGRNTPAAAMVFSCSSKAT